MAYAEDDRLWDIEQAARAIVEEFLGSGGVDGITFDGVVALANALGMGPEIAQDPPQAMPLSATCLLCGCESPVQLDGSYVCGNCQARIVVSKVVAVSYTEVSPHAVPQTCDTVLDVRCPLCGSPATQRRSGKYFCSNPAQCGATFVPGGLRHEGWVR